ncbi:MAG: DUF58 domain-containing protein [Firmicutes bacterium]|nr:DUF58 domain-containing protein [Bacillota bacterium]
MAKQRVAYLLVLTVSFGLFLWWEDYIVHLLFYFLLLLPLISLAVSLPLCFLLRCRVEFPGATAEKNRAVTLRLCLRNRWIVPAPCIRAVVTCENALGGFGTKAKQKVCFPVGFASESERPVTFEFPYCGKITVCVRHLRACDLLGIFPLPVLHRKPFTACLYVLPERQELECAADSGADLGQESSVYSEKKPGNDPAEIFRLRDYRPGDRLHAVHWKLSARLERLIVKEFGLPLNTSVRFLFELGRDADLAQADRLLEAFFSIAAFQVEEEMILTVQWLMPSRQLETRTVEDEDTLAEALHRLLNLQSSPDSDGALEAFSKEEIPAGCHLIYLSAVQNGAPAADLLEELLQTGVCGRVSVLTAGGEKDFSVLQGIPGCGVYSLNDGVLNAGLEEMKV